MADLTPRLVGMAPALASIVLALNASAIYLAIAASGAAGALAIRVIDAHTLPLLSAVLVLGSHQLAELAHRRVTAGSPVTTDRCE